MTNIKRRQGKKSKPRRKSQLQGHLRGENVRHDYSFEVWVWATSTGAASLVVILFILVFGN